MAVNQLNDTVSLFFPFLISVLSNEDLSPKEGFYLALNLRVSVHSLIKNHFCKN